MIRKGLISTLDLTNREARVIFPDLDSKVSYRFPIPHNIESCTCLTGCELKKDLSLKVGDTVVVGLWTQSDGAILAKI